MAHPGQEDALHRRLQDQVIPHAKLLDRSASQMLYSVDHEYLEELRAFFALMEDSEEGGLSTMVHEWGLSNSTLEEVFIRVTNKKKTKE